MTRGSTTIRRAKPTITDAEAIISVGRPVFEITFGHLTPPDELKSMLDGIYNVESVLTDLNDPFKVFFLALMNERVVAYSQLTIGGVSELSCLQNYKNYIKLGKIYVDVNHHGSGVSRTLMENTLNEAKRMGYANIYLTVYGENDRAKRFYEKFGFDKIGETQFTIGKRVVTDWVMLAPLQ
ncbi:hypothetical protein CI109_104405 [Kwoniella shandongensis]|uniref:Uncharacterized protein n=1 Tax=Kwoniella shandongensis TaxID=1734106 RepID=A0A5M6BXD5_9TREE|nr:uncharacterized protein CI109_004196 [Kwoniella shandongensis]KAA5527383.1 hypothetical protein CI109_004196 [Kwoniella shandongensis]